MNSLMLSICGPSLWAVLKPWTHSVMLFIGVMIFRFLFKRIMIALIRSLEKKMDFEILDSLLDAFDKPIQAFLLMLAIYLFVITCPVDMVAGHPAVDQVLRSCIIFCVIWGLYNLCDVGHGFILHMMKRAGLNIDHAIAGLLSAVAHILAVMLGFVMIAKEWNYDISAFIASLGIGSLAVALAAKDSLANVFGSVIIIMDKPFTVGDWIKTNSVEGIVEKVSFRSTGIRTFTQELVYVPNSLLSNTPIINYSRRQKYRIQFSLGLTYSSTADQLEPVCADILEFCRQDPGLYSDTNEVNFFDFGDSSLDLRVVCYAKTNTWREYLETRERLNLEIMKIMDRNGVGCAFPSMSLYMGQSLNVDMAHPKGVRIDPIGADPVQSIATEEGMEVARAAQAERAARKAAQAAQAAKEEPIDQK